MYIYICEVVSNHFLMYLTQSLMPGVFCLGFTGGFSINFRWWISSRKLEGRSFPLMISLNNAFLSSMYFESSGFLMPGKMNSGARWKVRFGSSIGLGVGYSFKNGFSPR